MSGDDADRSAALAIDMVEKPATPRQIGASPGVGTTLTLWAALIVTLHLVLWLGGIRSYALNEAVERGAARAEHAGVGEMGDEVLRKAVRIQQETYTFWAALVGVGDFLIEPLFPALRALAVATLFAGIAALSGRPAQFAEGLAGSARAQGWWVLGLGVRVVLMLALRRPEIETSAVLLLPPGTHPATTWVALRQLDAFAMLGWASLSIGGWRRRQVSLPTAVVLCGMLWLVESVLRIAATLMVGAGMRLTIMG